MPQGTRPERVGDLVRQELSLLLTREVRDPAAHGVVVTFVRMTRDLQHARVFYTPPSSAAEGDTARALRRARPFLKRRLGQRLRLRFVPELTFQYDDAVDRDDRLAALFERIAEESPVEPEDGDADR